MIKGFFAGLIFGGAYFRRGSLLEKILRFKIGCRLDNKNSLKHRENSLKQLTLTVHGLIFEGAYYRKVICVQDLGGLFSGGLILGVVGGGLL